MTPRIGPRTASRILLGFSEVASLEGLRDLPPNQLEQQWRVPTESALHFCRAIRNPLDDLNELEDQGIDVRLVGFPGYPKRLLNVLGNQAPPILLMYGNPEIVERSAVAFSGSRKASPGGLTLTAQSASVLSEKSFNVISGHAGGVDMAAHTAALKARGVTTIVLAEGILHFRPKQEIRELFDVERVLVVSEFLPRARWSISNAMRRNLTICGLADVVIAVEPRGEGGTLDAGKTALKFGRPLFIVGRTSSCERSRGEEYLLSHGARSLNERQSNGPDLSDVVNVLRGEEARELTQNGQGLLFGDASPSGKDCEVLEDAAD